VNSAAEDRAPLAVGLDLGSTRIKAGLLDRQGGLSGIESAPAPPLSGSGPIREGDAAAYARLASRVLSAAVGGLSRGIPLGIATQRSSFVLWDTASGSPLTPMISWQDRRATGWCERNLACQPEVGRRTGLLLSGHYAGPKLAVLLAERHDLRQALERGEALFGTLETYLTWSWSAGRVHQTDRTVAARTLMLDLESGDWSPELLELYAVPRRALPTVCATAGRRLPLTSGPTVTASLADQAAGALAVLEQGAGGVLVTLGTGGFVLQPTDDPSVRHEGYLTAPILGSASGIARTVLEGTINGAGAALDRFPAGSVELASSDSAPEAFCLPDVSGLGSPHWRADLTLTFSPAAERLSGLERRRVVLEGLLFRVRQILDDLTDRGRPRRVIVSGGVSAEPALGPGLAALLQRPVEILDEPEAGILGAARLAAGLSPFAAPRSRSVPPTEAGAYLPEKYPGWKRWLNSILGMGTFS